MSILKFSRRIALASIGLSLSACAAIGTSSPQPVEPTVPPQVAYRIDDHRYFEVTPHADGECTGTGLYFVDTAKGIHSDVVTWDNVMTHGRFAIDAANDQYLVAPVSRGGLDCSSGGGGCGDVMPYSTDGGRTWKYVWSPGNDDDVMVSGPMAYQSHRIQTIVTDGLDLTISKPVSADWKSIRNFVFKPRIAPVDTKVRCKIRTPVGTQ